MSRRLGKRNGKEGKPGTGTGRGGVANLYNPFLEDTDLCSKQNRIFAEIVMPAMPVNLYERTIGTDVGEGKL